MCWNLLPQVIKQIQYFSESQKIFFQETERSETFENAQENQAMCWYVLQKET